MIQLDHIDDIKADLESQELELAVSFITSILKTAERKANDERSELQRRKKINLFNLSKFLSAGGSGSASGDSMTGGRLRRSDFRHPELHVPEPSHSRIEVSAGAVLVAFLRVTEMPLAEFQEVLDKQLTNHRHVYANVSKLLGGVYGMGNGGVRLQTLSRLAKSFEVVSLSANDNNIFLLKRVPVPSQTLATRYRLDFKRTVRIIKPLPRPLEFNNGLKTTVDTFLHDDTFLEANNLKQRIKITPEIIDTFIMISPHESQTKRGYFAVYRTFWKEWRKNCVRIEQQQNREQKPGANPVPRLKHIGMELFQTLARSWFETEGAYDERRQATAGHMPWSGADLKSLQSALRIIPLASDREGKSNRMITTSTLSIEEKLNRLSLEDARFIKQKMDLKHRTPAAIMAATRYYANELVSGIDDQGRGKEGGEGDEDRQEDEDEDFGAPEHNLTASSLFETSTQRLGVLDAFQFDGESNSEDGDDEENNHDGEDGEDGEDVHA